MIANPKGPLLVIEAVRVEELVEVTITVLEDLSVSRTSPCLLTACHALFNLDTIKP